MASGHVNRIYRPNKWLHRPSLRREDFSCQPGAVRCSRIWSLSGHSGHGRTCCWPHPVANDSEPTSRCFGLGADIKNFAPELRSNNSSGLRSGIVFGGLHRRINALSR
jgi:hypothetical protein